MPKNVLKWGLLSTARINRALIPPLKASKRNQLIAVASRKKDAADAFAREWKIPQAYGSYESLLADPEIDVIYNPLPNHLHAEWSIKAIEAGKHVLCEKPIALSVEEVDAMKASAHKHGRVIAEAFMYRHHPQTLKVQELVKNGSLGTLKLIRGSFSFLLSDQGNVRLKPEWGGGSIWDLGCYPISYARSLVGEDPFEVFGWQVTGPTGIDATFVGQLRFADDVLMQFASSFVIPVHSFMEIVGSTGTLNIPRPFKPGTDEKIYLTRDGRTETINVKGQELYIGEVEDLADAILLGKEPRISLDDSRGNVQTICGLLDSAKAGKPVRIC